MTANERKINFPQIKWSPESKKKKRTNENAPFARTFNVPLQDQHIVYSTTYSPAESSHGHHVDTHHTFGGGEFGGGGAGTSWDSGSSSSDSGSSSDGGCSSDSGSSGGSCGSD